MSIQNTWNKVSLSPVAGVLSAQKITKTHRRSFNFFLKMFHRFALKVVACSGWNIFKPCKTCGSSTVLENSWDLEWFKNTKKSNPRTQELVSSAFAQPWCWGPCCKPRPVIMSSQPPYHTFLFFAVYMICLHKVVNFQCSTAMMSWRGEVPGSKCHIRIFKLNQNGGLGSGNFHGWKMVNGHFWLVIQWFWYGIFWFWSFDFHSCCSFPLC